MTSTNFIDGSTNVPESSTLGSFVMNDPSKVHTWFSDFDDFVSGAWTITKTGAGGTTAAVTGDGGVVKVLNDTNNNDNQFLQWAGNSGGTIETWKFETGKQFWLKSKFKLSDATSSAMVLGVQVTDTSPLAVSDGAYFYKAAASTTVQFKTTASSSTTTSTAGTLVSDTYVVVGFHYDGGSKVDVYWNDLRVATQDISTLPLTQTLTLSFGVQNGAAAAKSMSVDYLLVSKER